MQDLIDNGATIILFCIFGRNSIGLYLSEAWRWRENSLQSKAINILVVATDINVRLDLMITSLLHDVDLIWSINQLQGVNPLIDQHSSQVFLPTDAGTSALPCDWLDQVPKAGIVKVLPDVATIATLQDIEVE